MIETFSQLFQVAQGLAEWLAEWFARGFTEGLVAPQLTIPVLAIFVGYQFAVIRRLSHQSANHQKALLEIINALGILHKSDMDLLQTIRLSVLSNLAPNSFTDSLDSDDDQTDNH